jgi:N-hydroxyarylamine O-acetyltransferase
LFPIEIPLNRFLNQGKGGYCFQHNLVFAAVLLKLGFQIDCGYARVATALPSESFETSSGQRKRIQFSRGPTHMILFASLPWNLDNAHEKRLVDVGFGGNGLTRSIPISSPEPPHKLGETSWLESCGGDAHRVSLASVSAASAPEFYLEFSKHPSFNHPPLSETQRDWSVLYQFTLETWRPTEYLIPNFFMYASRDCYFTRRFVAFLSASQGRINLLDKKFTRRWFLKEKGIYKEEVHEIERFDEWIGVVRDDLGIQLTLEEEHVARKILFP